MELIGDLSGIIAFILFFRLIYLFVKSRKTKDWSKFKKDGIIFAVCFCLAGLFADTSSSDASSDTSNESSQKSEKVEKSSQKSSQKSFEQPAKETKKKSKKNNKTDEINKDFSEALSQDQDYYQSGNSDFEFSSYINGIKYTGDRHITVNVNSDFNYLSSDDKTRILNRVQGMVQESLLNHKEMNYDNCQEGVFITINVGKNSIGCSKISNYREYHFYD